MPHFATDPRDPPPGREPVEPPPPPDEVPPPGPDEPDLPNPVKLVWPCDGLPRGVALDLWRGLAPRRGRATSGQPGRVAFPLTKTGA